MSLSKRWHPSRHALKLQYKLSSSHLQSVKLIFEKKHVRLCAASAEDQAMDICMLSEVKFLHAYCKLWVITDHAHFCEMLNTLTSTQPNHHVHFICLAPPASQLICESLALSDFFITIPSTQLNHYYNSSLQVSPQSCKGKVHIILFWSMHLLVPGWYWRKNPALNED